MHSLRLSYLRNVDDPYGGRVIALSPSYTSNPYVLAASLADTARWPELEHPSSPPISDDDHSSDDKPPPPPAPGIRHHQTIMGNRSGALGMRVTGRRASTSRRASQPALDPESALSRLNPIATADASDVLSADPEPPAKEVQFIPKFKGAAEMEARRKLRMLARRGQASVHPKHASDVNKYLNPEISSSDDADGTLEDDDDFDLVDRGDDMDEGDEFDPYALYPPFYPLPDSRTATLLLRAPPVPVSTVHPTWPPSCRAQHPLFLHLIRPPLPHPPTSDNTRVLDLVLAPSQRPVALTSPAPLPSTTKASMPTLRWSTLLPRPIIAQFLLSPGQKAAKGVSRYRNPSSTYPRQISTFRGVPSFHCYQGSPPCQPCLPPPVVLPIPLTNCMAQFQGAESLRPWMSKSFSHTHMNQRETS